MGGEVKISQLGEKYYFCDMENGNLCQPTISVGIMACANARIERDDKYSVLFDVPIGKGFHWEQQQRQRFEGQLSMVGDTVVNVLPIERYIYSVIRSEMNASSPIELLKAHAIIARSWALAQIKNPPHEDYDVCADDHCQRYQGVGFGQPVPQVQAAIDSTFGMVLTCAGELCDARYSKCCGGQTEQFSTCWQDVDYPYLVSKPDRIQDEAGRSKQAVVKDFCDVDDKALLATVLNTYDQPTNDFYRWTVRYSRDEITQLVKREYPRIGTVQELHPLRRGKSGRISLLRIVGSEDTVEVGKELAIRKLLSSSCLYSSAFEVERESTGFVLRGKGWGHGVGLCQIGAANMAAQGYGYRLLYTDLQVSPRRYSKFIARADMLALEQSL